MTTEKIKRTTIELSLAASYVPTWGLWEALRELVQNAQDANDLGYAATYRHLQGAHGGALRIVNDGVTLPREAILLGMTSKTGHDNQRGQFGEGFKLAWLALARLGIKVRFRTGDEQWVPRIERSSIYQTDVLKVDISPITYRNSTTVDIFGVDDENWATLRERCRFLQRQTKGAIDVDSNAILTTPEQAGNLYVRGIFVAKLPGRYFYGYDLAAVKIDRDRRLADPWDTKYEIARVLGAACSRQLLPIADIWQLLQASYEEAAAVAEMTFNTQGLAEKVAAYFKGEYGDEALPVTDTAQTIEASHHGIKAVAVGEKTKIVIERVVGKYEERRQARDLDPKRMYSIADLTKDEIEAFTWATMLTDTCQVKASISIVDFYGDRVMGTFKVGELPTVALAKAILSDRRQLLATLVHELAHTAGADGTVEHRDACDRMFCDIIMALDK